MAENGVGPRKLWHWAAFAAIAVVFINEPVGSIRFGGDILQGVGRFGGTAIREAYINANNPDVGRGIESEPELELDLQPEPGSESDAELESGAQSGVYRIDGAGIETILDAGTDAVLALHDQVESAEAAGGFTVVVGNPNDRPSP